MMDNTFFNFAAVYERKAKISYLLTANLQFFCYFFFFFFRKMPKYAAKHIYEPF